VVVLIGLEGNIAAPHVPELDRLVVAGHQVVLLVRVVVDVDDASCSCSPDRILLTV
jgi:hypothetical protein